MKTVAELELQDLDTLHQARKANMDMTIESAEKSRVQHPRQTRRTNDNDLGLHCQSGQEFALQALCACFFVPILPHTEECIDPINENY